MARFETDALVIGAGVSGMSTALSLLYAGVPASSLRLIADRPPTLTASSSAGTIWGTYLSPTDHGTNEWSRYTSHRLNDLASVPATGVYLVPGMQAFRADDEPPEWAKEVEGFQLCTPDELPAGFVSGWRYTVPVIAMPLYLAERIFERCAAVAPELRSVHNYGHGGSGVSMSLGCAREVTRLVLAV